MADKHGESLCISTQLLCRIASYISAKHVDRLATGYLGITVPHLERIKSDKSHITFNIIFKVLNDWSIIHPNGLQRLIELLTKAGTQEGLVGRKPIAILKGNCYIEYLHFQYTPNSSKGQEIEMY